MLSVCFIGSLDASPSVVVRRRSSSFVVGRATGGMLSA
jgi:hypothetical protein